MPLAEISADKSEYGTRLEFAPCGMTVVSGTEHCMVDADHMGVQIWPQDRYDGHIQEKSSVPIEIGGRSGLFNEASDVAAVRVQPGMLVVFELGGPGPAESTTKLKHILAGVEWAPDPGNEATWRPVSDWPNSTEQSLPPL